MGPLKEAKLKLQELAVQHDGKTGEVIEAAFDRVKGWAETLVAEALP